MDPNQDSDYDCQDPDKGTVSAIQRNAPADQGTVPVAQGTATAQAFQVIAASHASYLPWLLEIDISSNHGRVCCGSLCGALSSIGRCELWWVQRLQPLHWRQMGLGSDLVPSPSHTTTNHGAARLGGTGRQTASCAS
eukprot:scaffold2747_cov104-Cylindrotheca_fusiformis.AAC.11